MRSFDIAAGVVVAAAVAAGVVVDVALHFNSGVGLRCRCRLCWIGCLERVASFLRPLQNIECLATSPSVRLSET